MSFVCEGLIVYSAWACYSTKFRVTIREAEGWTQGTHQADLKSVKTQH